MIEAVPAGHELMVQHIGIFVYSHFIGNLSAFVQLVVFGNFVLIVHENVKAELFLRVIVVLFAMR